MANGDTKKAKYVPIGRLVTRQKNREGQSLGLHGCLPEFRLRLVDRVHGESSSVNPGLRLRHTGVCRTEKMHEPTTLQKELLQVQSQQTRRRD